MSDSTPGTLIIQFGGRHHGRTFAMHAVSLLAALDQFTAATSETIEAAAPPIVEAVKQPRFERRNTPPPAFANPAKLARGERKHGPPRQWRHR